jgi:hypothetical protein
MLFDEVVTTLQLHTIVKKLEVKHITTRVRLQAYNYFTVVRL